MDRYPARAAPELRFSATFDKLNPRAGESVRCKVSAARVGFRGYGMMIAEVGLPPGAEADRATLEDAVSNSGPVDRYEVRPGRVLFYLWPKAGGVDFEFTFHNRFPMTAKSGPSVLYDYYNPESRTELAPVVFQAGPRFDTRER